MREDEREQRCVSKQSLHLNTINNKYINSYRWHCKDELLSARRFIALFVAPFHRQYFDSCNCAGRFGKSTTRRMLCTVRLKHETQYETHCGAAKMSFRQRGDLLLCWRMDRKWGIGLSTVVNGCVGNVLMAMAVLSSWMEATAEDAARRGR